MNKHSKLLHKVEVVVDEPIRTAIPATTAEPVVIEPVKQPVVEPVSVDMPMEMSGGDMLGMTITGAEDENGGKMIWVVVGLLVVIAIIVVGVVIYFSKSRINTDVVVTPTPSPAESLISVTPTATAAPTPKVDVAKVKMQILNGSGIKGEAGVAAKLLESSGFEGIKIGNAAKFNYEKTEVWIVNEKMTGLYALVEEVLGKRYAVINPVAEEEDNKINPYDKSGFDVVVVVGKDIQ